MTGLLCGLPVMFTNKEKARRRGISAMTDIIYDVIQLCARVIMIDAGYQELFAWRNMVVVYDNNTGAACAYLNDTVTFHVFSQNSTLQ